MGKKLYVGNLSYETSEEDLRAVFSGNDRVVEEIAIMKDRSTGQPRGFAFVTMRSEREAQAAMQAVDGQSVNGRALKVNEARERRDRY